MSAEDRAPLAGGDGRGGGPYAWYVLGVLVLVYALNFIDRTILSILAEDIKADMGLRDDQLGFLYGTAFGVFYSLFGIPLGRLADVWSRTRLMAIGLTLWSGMTTVSGLAGSFGHLAAARIGVGIGEATASPCAYSLLSDYFPERQRGLVLGIYGSGMMVGVGLSLFIGGAIVDSWNATFPDGGPYGLRGWQVAFFAVGTPGLVLAMWVASLREPARAAPGTCPPSTHLVTDLLSILPPFTLIEAARRGRQAVMVNIGWAATIAAVTFFLVYLTGDGPQWVALGVGAYAVSSWAGSLRSRDPAAYGVIWKSRTFPLATIGFALISLVNVSTGFWAAPYALRTFALDKGAIGLLLGLCGAAAGFAGIIAGGKVSDLLMKRYPAGRVVVALGSGVLMAPFAAAMYMTTQSAIFFACYALMVLFGSAWIGAAAATIQELVLPRMRATAAATYFVALTMIGLGLGPYGVGKISAATGSLTTGAVAALALLVPAVVCLYVVIGRISAAQDTVPDVSGVAGKAL